MPAAVEIRRRTFVRALFGIGVTAAAGAAGYGYFARGASLPPLSLPAGLGSLATTRLQRLHSRYDAAFVSGGAAALRTAVGKDLVGFRGFDAWQEIVVDWIDLAGWAHAADLMIDAAEVGGVDLRRTVASTLATRPTPLVVAATHGPRIVRLHRAETDAMARTYWSDLRRVLGI
jgi:hypothetical protein